MQIVALDEAQTQVEATGERAFTILDLLPDANSLRQTEIALRELYGFLYYQLRDSAEITS